MNFQAIRLGLTTAALAAGAILAALPAEAAKLYFTPTGMQLDLDQINDLALDVGDTLTIETFLDTTGLSADVGEVSYNVELNELGLLSVLKGAGNPLTLDSSSTSTRRVYTGTLAKNTVAALDVFTLQVLADLNNDGRRDFRAILEDVFDVNDLDVSSSFNPFEQRLEVQPVPTPALIPSLIGVGAAALRKRKKQEAEEAELAEAKA